MKTLTQLAASIERRMQEFAAVDLGKSSDNYGGCDIAAVVARPIPRST